MKFPSEEMLLHQERRVQREQKIMRFLLTQRSWRLIGLPLKMIQKWMGMSICREVNPMLQVEQLADKHTNRTFMWYGASVWIISNKVVLQSIAFSIGIN